LKVLLIIGSRENKTKKIYYRQRQKKIRLKKQNYDLKLKIEFSDDFVCTLIF